MVTDAQKLDVKKMLVEQLRLRMEADAIGDDTPLFQEGLGLDSVDAIELVTAIEEKYGVVLASEDEAKDVLVNVETLSHYIAEQGGFS